MGIIAGCLYSVEAVRCDRLVMVACAIAHAVSCAALYTLPCCCIVRKKNYAERRDRRTKEEMYGTANPLKIRMVKMQRQMEEFERMRKEFKESDELLDKLEREKQEKE